MTMRIAGLVLSMLVISASPASAQAAAKDIEAVLVPADFKVPVLSYGPGFKLVPLGPEQVKVDFTAYMSSIPHLQKTFSRSTAWPHKDISEADAMADMQSEQGRFAAHTSFAYAVLTPDGTRERGSVYVSPSPVPGHDAMVRMWVTQAEYENGFDGALYAWVANWVRAEWPFAKVAYPGRAIAWDEWDAQVAAQKALSAR